MTPPRGGATPLTPISVHILMALAEGPLHGYAVIKRIEQETSGGLVLEAGTLYAAIKRLLDEGAIEADRRRRPDDDDSRRRYYRLTSTGRRALTAECDRLANLLDLARRKAIIGPAGHRGSTP